MNIDGPDLEDRYRRVLRLLPGYYRAAWEEDMVAAFLDSRITGDEDEDEYLLEFGRPPGRRSPAWPPWPPGCTWAAQARRAGTSPGARPCGARCSLWRWCTRCRALPASRCWPGAATRPAGSPRCPRDWRPRCPAACGPRRGTPSSYAWIAVFLALVLGQYRTARVIAALAAAADLAVLLQAQLAGLLLRPLGSWSSWFLFDLTAVLAMAAFHRDAPPSARRPWLLAVPGYYLLVPVPVMVLQATGNQAWLPDSAGLGCLVVSLACLAHAPRALSRSGRAAAPGVWSLSLTLLAAAAGAWRVASVGSYVHDPHLITVSLTELLILAAAVALVAPDAARAQAAAPAPPPHPHPG